MNRNVAILLTGLACCFAAPAMAESAFEQNSPHHSGASKSEHKVHKRGRRQGVSKQRRLGHKGLRHGGVTHPVGGKRLGFPYGRIERRGFHQGRLKKTNGFKTTFGQSGVTATFGHGGHLPQKNVGIPFGRKHRPLKHGVRKNGHFRHDSGHRVNSFRHRHDRTHVIYHEPSVVEQVVVVSPQGIAQPSSVALPVTSQRRKRETPVKFVHINTGSLDPSSLLSEGIQEASSEDILGIDLQLRDGPAN